MMEIGQSFRLTDFYVLAVYFFTKKEENCYGTNKSAGFGLQEGV